MGPQFLNNSLRENHFTREVNRPVGRSTEQSRERFRIARIVFHVRTPRDDNGPNKKPPLSSRRARYVRNYFEISPRRRINGNNTRAYIYMFSPTAHSPSSPILARRSLCPAEIYRSPNAQPVNQLRRARGRVSLPHARAFTERDLLMARTTTIVRRAIYRSFEEMCLASVARSHRDCLLFTLDTLIIVCARVYATGGGRPNICPRAEEGR